MAKKNKGNRNKGDVAEFLLEQRRAEHAYEIKGIEMLGAASKYLMDTLIVPLLPAISSTMKTQAETANMRAQTERLQVEQSLEEARKSLKLKDQRRQSRAMEERLREVERPNGGKGRN